MKSPRGLKEVVQQFISSPSMNHSLGCRCSITLVLQQLGLSDLSVLGTTVRHLVHRLQVTHTQIVLEGNSLKYFGSSYCCQVLLQYSLIQPNSRTRKDDDTHTFRLYHTPTNRWTSLNVTNNTGTYCSSSTDCCRVSSFPLCHTHTHTHTHSLEASSLQLAGD